jgi:hypothetical protein
MSATITYIRVNLTRILIIIACVSAITSFYFVSPQSDAIFKEMSLWSVNITTFTLFVGLIAIFSRYYNNIKRRGENWEFQIYSVVVIIVWVIMGLMYGMYSNFYQTAYLSTKLTLHIAILGQLIFFVVSATYRTFRMRTFRTAVIAISALLMIAFNAPWLSTPFPVVDRIGFWLMNNPQMAASRAMVITGGIGGVVLGIRILLGIERGALRATEAE